jgi:hypothetical protein
MKLILSVLDNIEMWPMFYKFYRENGVTEFIINSYGPTISGPDITLYETILDPSVSIGQNDERFYEEHLRSIVGEYEWCIFADLDEFICIGQPRTSRIDDHIYRAAASGAEFIKGRFVDRVTKDGSFPKTLDDDLFAQFPVCRDISHGVMGGCGEKVVATMGRNKVMAGHHYIKPRTLRMYDIVAGVHHFKFWGAAEERIKNRKALYEANKIPWADQSTKFLQYLEERKGK